MDTTKWFLVSAVIGMGTIVMIEINQPQSKLELEKEQSYQAGFTAGWDGGYQTGLQEGLTREYEKYKR